MAGQIICLQCERPGLYPWGEKISCRRESLPTPVFWPGEFQGRNSPWVCKESDIIERVLLSLFRQVYRDRKNSVCLGLRRMGGMCRGGDSKRYRVSLLSAKDVLKLIVVMGTQLWTHIQLALA